MAKAFSLRLATEARPELGALLLGALQAAAAVPRRLPGHKALRTRFISFLHRMVESLGARCAPLQVGGGEGGRGRCVSMWDADLSMPRLPWPSPAQPALGDL